MRMWFSSRSAGAEGMVLKEKRKMTAAEEAWDLLKTVFYAVAIALVLRIIIFQPFNIPSGSMKPNLLVGDFLFVSKPAYGYSRASLIWPLTRLPIEGRIFPNVPERGDIIVFKNRRDHNKDYIKRVIGVPGDTIEMRAGLLLINGEPVKREYLGSGAEGCERFQTEAQSFRETLPNGVTYVTLECMADRGDLDDTALVFQRYARAYPEDYPQGGKAQYVVPDGRLFMMGDNRDNSRDSRDLNAVGYVPLEDVVGKADRLFFSVDGERARIWEIWNWPFAIRYGRILDPVK